MRHRLRFLQSPGGRIGATLVTIVVVIALFGPFFAPAFSGRAGRRAAQRPVKSSATGH